MTSEVRGQTESEVGGTSDSPRQLGQILITLLVFEPWEKTRDIRGIPREKGENKEIPPRSGFEPGFPVRMC